MHILLRKTNPALGQHRFYALTVSRTLFGEWQLLREWGRYGYEGGQSMVAYYDTEADAVAAGEKLQRRKIRKGYGAMNLAHQPFDSLHL
jgi:predicted DNA-binding WGR domain protein